MHLQKLSVFLIYIYIYLYIYISLFGIYTMLFFNTITRPIRTLFAIIQQVQMYQFVILVYKLSYFSIQPSALSEHIVTLYEFFPLYPRHTLESSFSVKRYRAKIF